MSTQYKTRIQDCVVPPSVPMGRIWITRMAVQASETPLAHLTPSGAAKLAGLHGGRLPTAAEVAFLALCGVADQILTPVLLPGIYYPGKTPGDPDMVTLAWCVTHDVQVVKQINPDAKLICGDGKYWTSPLGSLAGWPFHGTLIQPASGNPIHTPGTCGNDLVQIGGHSDYATTTRIVWDSDPGA